jgi:aminopeptidase-like protein
MLKCQDANRPRRHLAADRHCAAAGHRSIYSNAVLNVSRVSEPGYQMHSWASDLFPLCRSLTGDGVRETLRYLGERLPGLTLYEVPSGRRAFDWTVPQEWRIHDAFIADENGKRLVDFQANNLHVVGYSEAVDAVLTREELDVHLHSLPDQPKAIPYVTSYYKRRWGFCLSHEQRMLLPRGPFRVVIDAEFFDGHLTYADLVIPGHSEREIVFSTYVCHPSMANNELSGPVVQTALGRWLQQRSNWYTYRLIFVPETVGSVVYLSRHWEAMRHRTIAGWVISCVGDERAWSLLPSRRGHTIADRVSRHVLSRRSDVTEYSWLDRGGDERQYGAPGVDLPIASIMRSKYGTYPEYHTSLDDLDLITPAGLLSSLQAYQECVETLETSIRYQATILGEPHLSPRELYPDLSIKNNIGVDTALLLNCLTYADGDNDVAEVAEKCRMPIEIVAEMFERLARHGLVERA